MSSLTFLWSVILWAPVFAISRKTKRFCRLPQGNKRSIGGSNEDPQSPWPSWKWQPRRKYKPSYTVHPPSRLVKFKLTQHIYILRSWPWKRLKHSNFATLSYWKLQLPYNLEIQSTFHHGTIVTLSSRMQKMTNSSRKDDIKISHTEQYIPKWSTLVSCRSHLFCTQYIIDLP